MHDMTQAKRVIVVPRNGYVNRMQAWASASILANAWDAGLDVAWEREEIAAAQLNDLVRTEDLAGRCITAEELTDVLGVPHQSMDRHLTIDRARGTVFLAGHDRGEQAFMDQLQDVLVDEPAISTVVIVAGGKFCLPGTAAFVSKRRDFYLDLPWVSGISDNVASLSASMAAYVGLHIRETDRSHDAPTREAITSALLEISQKAQATNVFLASDTPEARRWWSAHLEGLGLSVWSNTDEHLDRSDERSGPAAMVDWLTLGRADGLVFSAASSFGHEAAVMCGDATPVLGLRASRIRRYSRELKRVSENAVRRLGG
jgi:hypothetical protein